MKSWFQGIAGFFLAAVLTTPAWGAGMAQPGTLNYVEGQASIGTHVLDSKSAGSTDLRTGQSLATQNGRAEVLLTPGVFFRLDDNSSVKMLSPSLTNTKLQLERGRATVEVAEIHRENNLRITEDDATTRLLKTGLYEFDASQGQIRVFKGKAVVQEDGEQLTLKGGRELTLNGNGPLKAKKFDKKNAEDDFYRWSDLRSKYLAEANVDAARIYVSNDWFGAGWYWDPWFGAYTFIPADGVFFSPFGWSFYSPLFVYRAPFVSYGYYGHYHHFEPRDLMWSHRGFARGPSYARDFHATPHPPGVDRDDIGRAMASPHAGFEGGFHGVGGFHGGPASHFGRFGGGRR